MNPPYVATPQGYRRKIGPASKYRQNARLPAFGDGIGPQGAQSSMNARSSFSGQTEVGMMTGPRRESAFQTSMREAREVSAANEAMFRREKRITKQARRAEEAKKAGAVQQSNTDKASASAAIAAAIAAASAAGGPMAGVAAAASKQATTKPAAPVMSREERNRIEEERRAKGRAKAEAERPGYKPTAPTTAPKMASQPPGSSRREESKSDFMKRMVDESSERQASKARTTDKQPNVAYSSPAPSGSNFGAARARSPKAPEPAKAPEPEKKQAAKPTEKPAPPLQVRPGSAVPQSVKNPYGLSARFNPPGSKPKTLEQDPIAKPFLAAGRAIVGAAKKGKRMIADQGSKNPHGLSARINRFLN
jgi:hypothetical protein